MRKIYLLIAILIYTVTPLATLAQLTESPTPKAVSSGPFKLGIGSVVELNSKINIFLGNLLNSDGRPNSLMVLDSAQLTINYISSSSLKTEISSAQPVLKLFPQQGGTCTGYAINDFLIQSHLAGLTGNGKLASDLSTEEGRSALLADSINQYYLVTQHRFSILAILNSFGKSYGFSCRKNKFTDTTSAQKFVLAETALAHPVLLSFNIGPNMYDGPFNLAIDNNHGILEDVRLWLPRKIGQRAHGGHSVVAAGQFKIDKSNYLIMLDSDWNLPRVWDVDAALGDRTAIKEIEFFTCK